MAEAMRDIKRRIRTVESTEHITNAMRLVSASKFRKAKGRYDRTSRPLTEVTEVMRRLLLQCSNVGTTRMSENAGTLRLSENAGALRMLENAGSPGTIIILITSNRGLCGGYNTGLLKLAAEEIRQRNSVTLYSIGSRGLEFFQREGIQIAGSFLEPPERMTCTEARTMADAILKEYQEGRAGEILLVGMKYVNTLRQETVVKRILPLETGTEEEAGHQAEETRCENLEFLPGREEVLSYLLPKYLELTLYKTCLEAAACEHAARRTAMESATDNAKEMLGHLSLTYNRARQQAITDELIEIVSGSEALR